MSGDGPIRGHELSATVVLRKGSTQRLKPFAERVQRNAGDPDGVTFRLVQKVLDGPNRVISTWPARYVYDHRDAWMSELLDAVRDETEGVGARCEFEAEAVDPSGHVIQSYSLIAQPAGGGDSPSAEGLTSAAMAQSRELHRVLMSERGAVVEAFKDVIVHLRGENAELREEIHRLRGAERERAESYHQAHMELIKREREVLESEIMSDARRAEREDERFDSIAEKLTGGAESVAMEAVKAAINRMTPDDVRELMSNNLTLFQRFMGRE